MNRVALYHPHLRRVAALAFALAITVPQIATAASPVDDGIDADRAYGYLGQICAFGPRPTGSPGMEAQQKLIDKHFTDLGGKVTYQKFRIRHPVDGSAVPVANMLVEWNPDAKERIVLCVHYDTRPLPDEDPNRQKRRSGVFIGANDGGSGVALLMELAHQMASLESNYGVDFLLVDAEEFMFQTNDPDRWFVGSRYFAAQYAQDPPAYRYRWGVVLDMIGDKDLKIYQERNSIWWKDTRPLVEDIWATAKDIGVAEFVDKPKHTIRDDHLSLRNIGKIPTCSVIDFDYPRYPKNRYWHTEADTLDKCSGESLAKVAWVMYRWLGRVE